MTDGRITPAGAVVDVLVGVGPRRERLLKKLRMVVPPPVAVRAVIDTGANISGFTSRVFTALQLPPVGKVSILTPSTRPDAPHQCDLFDITLYLVANGSVHRFLESRAMAAEGWRPDREEGVEGLIGRDVLDRSGFHYHGLEGSFQFGFPGELPAEAW